MKHNAKIYLKGSQIDEAGFRIILDGTVSIEKTGVFIEYVESENNTTQVGISENIVTVSRFGESVYTIVYEKDVPVFSHISTPYGKINFNILPTLVKCIINENSINVELQYDMSLNDSESSKAFLLIECIF